QIRRDFGPGRPAFSPTQLESLALCPFQFYLRHVLHLRPIEERDELDDDRATRGSVIHKALEELHSVLRGPPTDTSATLADQVAGNIEDVLIRVIGEGVRSGSEIDPGRSLIERGQLVKVGRRYALQYARYAEKAGLGAVGHEFEVIFGDPRTPKIPSLVLGQGLDAVPLQGRIDRIDLVKNSGQTLFRIIDYKTGYSPNKPDVDAGLALQLPLYALAVERLALAGEAASPADVGYWSLSEKGYKSVKTMTPIAKAKAELETWETFREALETYVLALVTHLRAARFPVAPRKDDCTRSCDFRAVCRIKQVRTIGKTWTDAPRLGTSQ
ncbi:MAG: PD-(D/E)XK nuclease family protein, partial [Isosphaeraceae bacterium]